MVQHSLLAAASLAFIALSASPVLAQQGQRPACGVGKPVTVNLLFPTQPVNLDGNYDTLVLFSQINRNLYDGLFKLDDEMKVQPNLATGYTQIDDVTYDIALREGVTFHDGSPFTAADVVSSFMRITNDAKLASKQKTYARMRPSFASSPASSTSRQRQRSRSWAMSTSARLPSAQVRSSSRNGRRATAWC